MIDFYHNKGIDMLKLGWTLPNLAHYCLHEPTTANFYPFTESNSNLSEIIGDMVGGSSIVLLREAVMDETFIRELTHTVQ